MQSCFILRRTKGGSLYLTPFVDPKTSTSWSEDEDIRWHASTGLHTNEKDDALFTLYTQIDRGVDRWIQDARYLPRLLISALVFLVTYFFFSLAVRDPIPMIDELLISGALAAFTAVTLTRRDKKSEVAMKRRLVLKQQASRSDFSIEDGLSSYEEFLDTCSFIDTIDLAERLAMTGNSDLPTLTVPEERHGAWQEDFKRVLLRHVELSNKSLFAWYRRALEIHRGKRADEAFAARLVKLSMQGQIDLPLLSLLVVLTK